MNTRNTGYWVSTGLVAVGFGLGGVMDLTLQPAVVEGIQSLGYPTYVAVLLGVWKLLGSAAVLAPRLPRLKEWAYAGMFFDLTGALVSHAAVGDGADKLMPPLVLLVAVLASWLLRPESKLVAGKPILERRAGQAALRPRAA